MHWIIYWLQEKNEIYEEDRKCQIKYNTTCSLNPQTVVKQESWCRLFRTTIFDDMDLRRIFNDFETITDRDCQFKFGT